MTSHKTAKRLPRDPFLRDAELRRRARQRVYELLAKDPAYLRLDARKDAALRAWTLAEHAYLVTKRAQDREAMVRAETNAKRVLRALYKYEAAFFRKHGVSQ